MPVVSFYIRAFSVRKTKKKHTENKINGTQIDNNYIKN